ncbi:hypothetical protein QA648_27860 (plasmid) [Rhizobium sp. CB3171]|uniref:hypothetical protein n=1 Tax=Rhizobium sp. CB3171 TaxID=3039157 RepID=UPI0024B094FF|nr:hypothetical protein [Rhizobium sp. CB3171]WFU04593.1 hypothetical protein QA648_27860 [Rhizobium sp. CB3171]
MSGPKVVKIVTREELIDICRGHIAALKAAAGQWERVGKRNDAITDVDISAVQARIAAMEQLLAADKFADLQKRVPAEIAFLASDVEDRLQQAADAKASKRTKEKRLRATAATVSRMLRERQMPIPAELSDPGRYSLQEIETAISKAVGSFSQSQASSEPSKRQLELASALSQNEERTSFAAWLQHQMKESDPKLSALERQLDELKALDPHTASAFEEPVQSLADELPSRQSLLIDSLTIDVATAKRDAKERFGLMTELASLRAQLALLNNKAAAQRLEEIDGLEIGNPPVSKLKVMIDSSSSLLEDLRKAKAEFDRRRTLLSGLAELGYEIKEGMETAWVENGRIVLKRTMDSNTGIELGGNPQAALQMRAVAFTSTASPHDTAHDVKAETKFCDDIAELRSKFASTGTDFAIVRAVDVGATPVKTIVVDDERERRYDAADRRPSEQFRK